ncbi:MAG: zinc-ribbon domain-containing protein [Candidatus Hodarchaeales archaeon]
MKEQPRPVTTTSSIPSKRERERICSNCGTKNTPDAQFCSQCAALL